MRSRASSECRLHSTSMTVDEITFALKSSDAALLAALRAGLAKAEELAPLVFATADKLCRGVYLLPEENDLLFYGLHILAAARHPELFDRVLMMAQQSEEELNQIFPEHIPTSLARLLLSVWNNDADALFELIEHADMIPEAKWALFDVLARLTSQIPDLGLDDMSWRQDHGIFFRCQTAPLKYSYILGGMFSSCACAMCLRTVSEYWKRSPQMRQCHWSRAKMYGRHSGLFGSSLGLGIFKSCKKNRNRAIGCPVGEGGLGRWCRSSSGRRQRPTRGEDKSPEFCGGPPPLRFC
jgi:hypothetical protein